MTTEQACYFANGAFFAWSACRTWYVYQRPVFFLIDAAVAIITLLILRYNFRRRPTAA